MDNLTVLQTSNKSLYDVVIVGAGINGCCSAYTLHHAGLNVAIIDQSGIASGGSGAAGAFISPKISKAGELKEIMEVAHREALEFYTTNFPQYTLTKPLLHIANDPKEEHKVKLFKESTSLEQLCVDDTVRGFLSDEALSHESIFFAKGAVVDAVGICNALVEGIDFFCMKVDTPIWEEGVWRVGERYAKHIVIAIGAYPKIIPSIYVGLRGIWGHRIDIETSTDVPVIFHHHVSISPTMQTGVVAIGATHDVHYSPFCEQEYDVQEGQKILLEKASKTLKLNNIKVLRDYTGLRSGSNDYLPMLGALVDANTTLEHYPHICHGQDVDPENYHYYPNCTMINGSGGYGFVLAPYLAKRLKEYLVDKQPLDEVLSPSRFFPRWAKRQS
jgi:tRNA 5-methylaminomethyl-2-thiouridine biosynthesis bifunctional protein